MIDPRHDPIDCALCGGVVLRTLTTISVSMGSRGEIPVAGEYAKCESCGEAFLAYGEGDALYRAACDVVREREGLLTPDEILALRVELGLTQAELEDVLRVGPKTVVRWERGTVFQGRAADTLLRTLREVPAARTFLLPRQSVHWFDADSHRITLEHAIANFQDSPEPIAVPMFFRAGQLSEVEPLVVELEPTTLKVA